MSFLPSMPQVWFGLSDKWKSARKLDISVLRKVTPWPAFWICHFIFLGFFLRICFPSDSRFWLSPWPSFGSVTFALGGAAAPRGYLGLKYVTALHVLLHTLHSADSHCCRQNCSRLHSFPIPLCCDE